VLALDTKNDHIPELRTPIKVTIDEIQKNMYKFVKEFPADAIPHVTENNEIRDTIHPQ
jgi:hypothetical protein